MVLWKNSLLTKTLYQHENYNPCKSLHPSFILTHDTTFFSAPLSASVPSVDLSCETWEHIQKHLSDTSDTKGRHFAGFPGLFKTLVCIDNPFLIVWQFPPFHFKTFACFEKMYEPSLLPFILMSLLCLSVPKDLIPTVGVLTLVYQVPSTQNIKEDVRTKDHRIYLTFMSFKGKIPAKPVC
jgi:hypothetical protein